eukprot:3162655-Karenia_brevis.AAC.1
MAELKLITSDDRPYTRMSLRSRSADCQCPPFSHAEMAVLKMITLGDKSSLRIWSSNGSADCHCPPS